MGETPLSVPTRPLPDADDLTDAQWAIVLALCDTIIPSLPDEAKADGDNAALQQFWAEAPSSNPVFRALMRRILFDVLSLTDKTMLVRVIKVLR